NRLRSGMAGLITSLASGRARYFVPPLLAALVVAAIWIGNAVNSGGQTGTTPAGGQAAVDAPVNDNDNLSVPQAPAAGNVVPLGGVDTSDTDRRIAFWQARIQTQPKSETAWI